jgi:hypothetical protein
MRFLYLENVGAISEWHVVQNFAESSGSDLGLVDADVPEDVVDVGVDVNVRLLKHSVPIVENVFH